jgi:hypothetical protein
MAYTDVWIMLEVDTGVDDLIQGAMLSASQLMKLHGVSSSYGVRCHVRQVYSERQLTVEIRAALEMSCGLLVEDRLMAGDEASSGQTRGKVSMVHLCCCSDEADVFIIRLHSPNPHPSSADPKTLCRRDDLVEFAEKYAAAEEETQVPNAHCPVPSPDARTRI